MMHVDVSWHGLRRVPFPCDTMRTCAAVVLPFHFSVQLCLPLCTGVHMTLREDVSQVEIAQVHPKVELAPLVFDGCQRPP